MEIANMTFPGNEFQEYSFHINIVKNPCVAHIPHTHENYFQIYYVIKSSLVHHVEGGFSPLSRGDMFIIPPSRMHFVELQDNTEFYCLSFYLSFLEERVAQDDLAIQFLKKLESDQENQIKPKLTVEPKDFYYIETIMEHILKEFDSKRFGYKDISRMYTLLLVSMFARSYFIEANQSLPVRIESNKQYVLRCIEYIKTNFTEQISLEDICKRSTMSKGSFCSLFLQLTGYSFNTYLNMCRINKAKEYIKNGYNISAIYGFCGYNTFSTFHRNFKKIMGITPQEYKNIQRKSDK